MQKNLSKNFIFSNSQIGNIHGIWKHVRSLSSLNNCHTFYSIKTFLGFYNLIYFRFFFFYTDTMMVPSTKCGVFKEYIQYRMFQLSNFILLHTEITLKVMLYMPSERIGSGQFHGSDKEYFLIFPLFDIPKYSSTQLYSNETGINDLKSRCPTLLPHHKT